MLIKSAKGVQKLVQKSARKPWILIVQKMQIVERTAQKVSFTQMETIFKQVFVIFYHNFRTDFLSISPLVHGSFAPFTHRTTNTTITFNNEKEISF